MNLFTFSERVFPSVASNLPIVFCRLSVDRCASKVHTSEKCSTFVTFGQDMSVRNNKGFTLIELMIVLVVGGILMSIAAPSFTLFQRNMQISSAAGEVVQGLNEARARAIAGKAPVQLSPRLLGVIGDGVKVVARNAGGGDIASLGFDAFGRLISNANVVMASGSVVICSPDAGNETGRSIVVSRMGRVNTSKVENPAC